MSPPRAGRRAPAPPPELSGELVRPRLLTHIGRRFEVPLTVVVAGAGFGKSTLLAQAIRANQLEPRGLDSWVSCEPGDGDAERLTEAIVDALGELRPPGPPDRREPAERVIDALAKLAPVDVCLLIDDVHEVPAGSSAGDLLTAVVARLPPHAHVVFAGRRGPPVPLARRRAAGHVVDIGVQELAFTSQEVTVLAEQLGRDAGAIAADAGGWPSLVRLALSAPEGSTRQFLWQEVVAGLPADQQRALLALATLGWGTAADVADVAADVLADDSGAVLDALVEAVPLLQRGNDGVYGVHRLWEEAVERIFPAADCDGVRRRALQLFQRRGETLRTGWSALRWGDAATLGTAARHLVRDSFGALPIDTAARWLAGAPDRARASPDMKLLELALRHARHYDDPSLDADLDVVVERLAAEGDEVSAAVGLALAAVIAHTRGDIVRLLAIDERARSLPGAANEPILRFLAGAMVAAKSSLEGDPAAAIRAIEELSFDDVPPLISELVVRLHANLLCLAGRADEAIPVATPLLDSPSGYVRTIPNHVRWWSADPSGFAGGHVSVEVATGTNERYHFYHAVYLTAVAASFGDVAAIESLRPVIERFAAGALDSRDEAMIAAATALRHVAGHDEDEAARVIAEHVDRHPADDRLADIHLRRWLAVGYVCDERIRHRWGDAELGPSQHRQRGVADALLAARAGALADDDPLPPPPVALTSLPLAWSIELAARAVSCGNRAALDLAQGLTELAPAARAELERAADAADRALADGAIALLDQLPTSETAAVQISVLGPLSITAGDDRHDVELRRGRVRSVIALLAVLGPLRRDRIADLLWPDLDAEAAARNLRVTLSRLRSALAPASGARGASPLRIDHDVVALAEPHVDVDLWRFRADVAAAAEAEHRGDTAAMIAALQRACGRWRGAPLEDVELAGELSGAVAETRRQVADSALRLGELLLVAGHFHEAAAWATRVTQELPYSERAHRLRIASYLQLHDTDAIDEAVATTRSMVQQIGVEPEPATRMLLRQAEARLMPAPA